MLRFSLYFFLFLAAIGCVEEDRRAPLTIAAASSMQGALVKIGDAYKEETGQDCRFVFGSSGKLTAQLEAGAPYDVFISADLEYPNYLVNKGVVAGPTEEFVIGRLVFFSNLAGMNGPEDLGGVAFDHLVLANPLTAPYGRAAVESLRSMGLYDAVADRLVYGESVSQSVQFLQSGSAGVGFTAAALAGSLAEIGRVKRVDQGLHESLVHGLVVSSNQDERIASFLSFLRSETAREILVTFGYDFP